MTNVSVMLSLVMMCLRLSAVPQTPIRTQQIKLDAGWNLISFQVLPSDRSPASVFASLGDNFVSAWAYTRNGTGGVWSAYSRVASNNPEQNQITLMGPVEVGAAYWVYCSGAVPSWQITGAPPSTVPPVNLFQGWNAFGVPIGAGSLDEPVSIAAVMAAAGANYEIILRWERGQYLKFYNSSNTISSDFTTFDPNKGYWINIRSNAFSLQPKLLVTVRPDSDVEPQGNYPGPEDLKLSDSPVPLDSSHQTHIVFLPDEDSQTLSIANTGGGILLWALDWTPLDATNVNWLVMSAAKGVTTVESDIITLGIDRKNLIKGTYRGLLTLRTTAGNRTFQVVANIGDVGGEWRGTATITSVNGRKNPVPDVDLFLSFYEDPVTPGLFRGYIDSQNALLWPVDVPLIGHVVSTTGNAFTLGGGYVLPPGDQNNPPYDKFQPDQEDVDWDGNKVFDDLNPFPFPIYRSVFLNGELTMATVVASNGSRTNGFVIEGRYEEILYGMLRQPIRSEGRFLIRREGVRPFASRRPVLNGESITRSDPVVLRGTNYSFGLPLGGSASSPLRVLTDMAVQDIQVDAEVDTTSPQTLAITLVAPSGASVRLHDRALISTNTLKQVSFPSTRAPVDSLSGLIGQGVRSKGDWQLRLTGGNGFLRSWRLRLQGQPLFDFSGKVANSTGGGLPAVVTVDGVPFSQSTVAASDGSFRFERMPGIPLNLSVSLGGYVASDPTSPGLGANYRTPSFPAANLSPIARALAARFRPLPVVPFPASLTAGFTNYGESANPVTVTLQPDPTIGSQLRLIASPPSGPVPLSVQFLLLGTVPLGSRIVWDFGDGNGTDGIDLVSVEHTFSRVGPDGFTVRASVGASAVTSLVAAMPSPRNSPYTNGFFEVFFSSGGTVPTSVASLPEARAASAPPALANLIMVQHADAASFDIDRAPRTTPANRAFASDGFSSNGFIVNGSDSIAVSPFDLAGGFQEEDSNYYLDPTVWNVPNTWDIAANFGYTTPDDQFHPQPRIGANPSIVDAPRVRVLCNVGPHILPPPNSEVFAVPMRGESIPLPASPDPLFLPGKEGIASSRDFRLVTGPLAWSWKLSKEWSNP